MVYINPLTKHAHYVYTLVWQFFAGEIVLFSQFNHVVRFWQLFWGTFGG